MNRHTTREIFAMLAQTPLKVMDRELRQDLGFDAPRTDVQVAYWPSEENDHYQIVVQVSVKGLQMTVIDQEGAWVSDITMTC